MNFVSTDGSASMDAAKVLEFMPPSPAPHSPDPALDLELFEYASAGAGRALLRLAGRAEPGHEPASPVLIVRTATETHHLPPLPGGRATHDGTWQAGFATSSSVVAGAIDYALEIGGQLFDLPSCVPHGAGEDVAVHPFPLRATLRPRALERLRIVEPGEGDPMPVVPEEELALAEPAAPARAPKRSPRPRRRRPTARSRAPTPAPGLPELAGSAGTLIEGLDAETRALVLGYGLGTAAAAAILLKLL